MRCARFRCGLGSLSTPEDRCPAEVQTLPETVAALKEAIALRPKHKVRIDENLVFITKYGHAWAKKTQDGPISKEMTKLLKRIGLYRPGLGFYSLRRTFETIGGDACDRSP